MSTYEKRGPGARGKFQDRRGGPRKPEAPKAEAPVQTYDLDAERMVLATMMTTNSLVEKHSDKLNALDFGAPLHVQIFDRMVELVASGKPANQTTVMQAITEASPVPDMELPAYMKALNNFVKAAKDLPTYIEVVKLWSKRRRVMELAARFQTMALTGDHDIVERLSQEVLRLSNDNRAEDAFTHMGCAADDALARIRFADEHGWGPTGIPTGFPEIDMAIGGFKSSKFYVIAAMEKAGKSSLGLAFVHNLIQQDVPTAIFSLEMKKDEVMDRLIMLESGISIVNRPRGQKLSVDEWQRIEVANSAYHQYKLFCNDLSDLTPSAITMACRHAVKQWGVQAVVIDYLQIMNSDDPNRDETRKRVEEASKAMRKMAKELDIIVIALAQLNRKPLERVSGKTFRDFKPELARPRRGDIRETAQIEMDADAIIALYRPAMILEEMRPINASDSDEEDFRTLLRRMENSIELNIILNRSGPSGVKAPVHFNPALMKFSTKRDAQPPSGPLNTGFGNHMTPANMRPHR